jgi:hypothetical protein
MKRFIFVILFCIVAFALEASDWEIVTDWGHIDDLHWPDTIHILKPHSAETLHIASDRIWSSSSSFNIGSSTQGTFKQSYDAAAYWTATQADGGGVTFNSISDGTARFSFSDPLSFDSSYSDHIIDIQPATSLGDNKAIYIGTWGTEAEFNDGGGLFRIYGKVDTGGTASANIFVRTLTESTSPPISAQFYTDCSSADSASAPNTMDGADFFAILNANSYFAEGSSMMESMRAVWAKVGGDASAHCYGNVEALWVDNQMNCAVSGEEYGIFSTTGGTKPDAWAGFETTSSGYTQFLYFDETFNSGAGTCITTDAVPGGNQDARIKVYYNATQYYIPLYR